MQNWQLIDANNNPVTVGDVIVSFRGEQATLKGCSPPQHAGSTGRVYAGGGEYYPSVYGLKWVSITDEA